MAKAVTGSLDRTVVDARKRLRSGRWNTAIVTILLALNTSVAVGVLLRPERINGWSFGVLAATILLAGALGWGLSDQSSLKRVIKIAEEVMADDLEHHGGVSDEQSR